MDRVVYSIRWQYSSGYSQDTNSLRRQGGKVLVYYVDRVVYSIRWQYSSGYSQDTNSLRVAINVEY